MGSDLALNILCAVANPLGAEGMLRIVRGALKSRDMTKDLKSVALPVVLVQVRVKLVYPYRVVLIITSDSCRELRVNVVRGEKRALSQESHNLKSVALTLVLHS